ncbi:MAG: hypothetical protein ACX93T_01285 [Bacteroidota bacterium]
MEDYFGKLFYLVVGMVYFFVKHLNKHSVDEQPATDTTSERLPNPVSDTELPSTWTGAVQAAQQVSAVKKLSSQTAVKREAPDPDQAAVIGRASQKPKNKQASRVLRRYGGWRKAIVMEELIRPYF